MQQELLLIAQPQLLHCRARYKPGDHPIHLPRARPIRKAPHPVARYHDNSLVKLAKAQAQVCRAQPLVFRREEMRREKSRK